MADLGGNRTPIVVAIALVTALAPAAGALAPASASADEASTETADAGWSSAPSPAGTMGWGIGASTEALVVSTVHDGSFRSTDNGQTWEPVDAGIDEGDIVFDPSDPTRAYYAGFGGLTRTTDAGATWENVLDFRRSMAVAVHDDGTVVASVDTGDWVGELKLSEDHGDTWTTLDWPSDSTLIYGLEFGSTADNIVVVSIGDTWVTHDGGDTWTHEDTGARALTSEDDGTLWRAGFSGLHRSTDDGSTWTSVTAPSTPDTLANKPGGGIYGATGDGVIFTDDGGDTWTNMGGADAAWAATGLVADPHNPDAVFMSDEGIGVSWIGPDGEGGFNFEGRTTGFPAVETFGLEVSEDGDTMFAGTQLGLYLSTDAGQSWVHTGAGIGADGIATAAVGPNGEHLYGGDSNMIFQPIVLSSQDGGSSFQFSILEGNDGIVTGLDVDPENPDRAWAAANIELTDSKVYETTDGGETWTRILEIPESIHDVAYDADNETLYAGTGLGVLASPTAGDAWVPVTTPTTTRALDAEAGVTYAGNDEGDLWRSLLLGPVLAPGPQAGSAVDTVSADPVTGDSVWASLDDGTLVACSGTLLDAGCSDRTPPPGAVHDTAIGPQGERVIASTPDEGLWSLGLG